MSQRLEGFETTCFADTQHTVVGICIAGQNGPNARLIAVASREHWSVVRRVELVNSLKQVSAVY